MDKNLSGRKLKLVYLRIQSWDYFFLFSWYMVNDLLDNLESNVKPIADDTSVFSVANESDTTSVKLSLWASH